MAGSRYPLQLSYFNGGSPASSPGNSRSSPSRQAGHMPAQVRNGRGRAITASPGPLRARLSACNAGLPHQVLPHKKAGGFLFYPCPANKFPVHNPPPGRRLFSLRQNRYFLRPNTTAMFVRDITAFVELAGTKREPRSMFAAENTAPHEFLTSAVTFSRYSRYRIVKSNQKLYAQQKKQSCYVYPSCTTNLRR